MQNKHRRKRRHPGVRRRTPPGTAPGTLTPVPGSPRPSIRVIAFGDDQFLEQSVADPEDLREIRQRYAVTWVDVEGLGDVAAVQRLGDIFGLHSLALEDVVNTHQRAKVDHYDEPPVRHRPDGPLPRPAGYRADRACFSARTLW